MFEQKGRSLVPKDKREKYFEDYIQYVPVIIDLLESLPPLKSEGEMVTKSTLVKPPILKGTNLDIELVLSNELTDNDEETTLWCFLKPTKAMISGLPTKRIKNIYAKFSYSTSGAKIVDGYYHNQSRLNSRLLRQRYSSISDLFFPFDLAFSQAISKRKNEHIERAAIIFNDKMRDIFNGKNGFFKMGKLNNFLKRSFYPDREF